MIEGLLISVVGMAVVFVVLTILMFVIMGMERLFRERATAVDKVLANEGAEPAETVEAAAIALAIASYLRERGKDLKAPITIGGVHYEVEIGDLSHSPVSLMVNQDSYRAAVGDEGLPITEQVSPKFGAQAKGTRSGLGWRSAYHQLQGKYWSRGGWTGRRS